jgi:NitT/TauT family transport system substrate-binding protein
VLFDSSKAPGLITDVLFFDAAFIEKNPKVVAAVMRGYLDGLAYLKSKPEESRKIVAKAMSVTAAEVKEQQKGVYNIPPAEMAGYFQKRSDSKSLFHVGAGISEILVKRGQIPAAPAIENTFDLRFVSALPGAK